MCTRNSYLIVYKDEFQPVGLWDCEVMPEWKFNERFKADISRIQFRLATESEKIRYKAHFQDQKPIKFDILPYHFVGDRFHRELVVAL